MSYNVWLYLICKRVQNPKCPVYFPDVAHYIHRGVNNWTSCVSYSCFFVLEKRFLFFLYQDVNKSSETSSLFTAFAGSYFQNFLNVDSEEIHWNFPSFVAYVGFCFVALIGDTQFRVVCVVKGTNYCITKIVVPRLGIKLRQDNIDRIWIRWIKHKY